MNPNWNLLIWVNYLTSRFSDNAHIQFQLSILYDEAIEQSTWMLISNRKTIWKEKKRHYKIPIYNLSYHSNINASPAKCWLIHEPKSLYLVYFIIYGLREVYLKLTIWNVEEALNGRHDITTNIMILILMGTVCWEWPGPARFDRSINVMPLSLPRVTGWGHVRQHTSLGCKFDLELCETNRMIRMRNAANSSINFRQPTSGTNSSSICHYDKSSIPFATNS